MRAVVAATRNWHVILGKYDFLQVALRSIPSLRQLEIRGRLALLPNENEIVEAFILRYARGDGVPPHCDSDSVWRINVLVDVPPGSDGGFHIDGRRIPMAIGDGVVFDPSRMLHSVDRVEGARVIWSMGIVRRTPRHRRVIPLKL